MSTAPSLACPVPTYDPILAKIVAETESAQNAFAVRFERKTFNNVTNQGTITPVISRIMSANKCNADTARAIYSMSWGAFQEMGFNIYNSKFGYSGPIATFCNDTDAQHDLYALFLQDDGINWTWTDFRNDATKLDLFAVKYNGSTDYVPGLVKAARDLGYM
jgi:hypothetical protein